MSIFALIFSGFYIHNPYGFFRWMFDDMDAARKVHFIFMYCVIAGLVGRLYYAFASGDYKNFAMGQKDMANMLKLMLYYLFITDEEPDWGGKYNPGQKGMYAAFAPLLLIQIIHRDDHDAGQAPFPVGRSGSAASSGSGRSTTSWPGSSSICVAAHMYLDFTEGMRQHLGMFTGTRPVKVHHRHESPLVHRATVKG